MYVVSLPGRRFRRVYAGIRDRIPQIFAIITATQCLRRAVTRTYSSRHTVHVHVFRPNDQKSLGRPIVYASVHRSELASLASLEMKITSYTPANGGHGGSARSLATGRVFLPVTTVLRSPVIIMLNDSAEARVNAPTLASTGSCSLDMEHGYYHMFSETVSCYTIRYILLW